jgi:hypothetical protein
MAFGFETFMQENGGLGKNRFVLVWTLLHIEHFHPDVPKQTKTRVRHVFGFAERVREMNR